MRNPIFFFRATLTAAALILAIAAVITACSTTPRGNASRTITLTIGAKENLASRITAFDATNPKTTWTSSNDVIVSVDEKGTVTALMFRDSTSGTGTAEITATAEGGRPSVVFTVIATMEPLVDMMKLPPLKDQFAEYFLIGNIFHNGNPRRGIDSDVSRSGTIDNDRLTRHFNVLTAENEMKPSYLCGTEPGQYNAGGIATAKRMVDAALAADIKVVGHTLLWHEQIPLWQQRLRTDNTTSAQALVYMREYITHIMTEFKGKVYVWDVLNEVFPDGVTADSNWRDVMRKDTNGNPWYMKIGADFVYEAYLAARRADPDAILYYNDFNMNQTGKARMVRNMVNDVNERYKRESGGTRLLIEGIGMQSHHNTGVMAGSVKNALDLFRPLGVRISISELDVLSQSWNEFRANPEPNGSMDTTTTNLGRLEAANLYRQYFKVFLDNADIIERVSFWGVYDEQSWRAKGLPLLFVGIDTSRAKPAYYSVVNSLVP